MFIDFIIQDMRTNFPNMKFVNLLQPNDSQDVIIVKATGGTSAGEIDQNRVDATYQVISRAREMKKARNNIMAIYEEYKAVYDRILTGFETGSFLHVAKISANQYPGEMELGEAGFYSYSVNFTVIFSD